MSEKLYFCVVEDYQGNIAVSSFLGRNRAQEKSFALSASKALHFMTVDHDAAQRYAVRLRHERGANVSPASVIRTSGSPSFIPEN